MNAFGTFNGLFRRLTPKSRVRALLTAAHDLGIRTLDTAPIYCRGVAEQRIGECASADFEVWTKVGVSIDRPLPLVDFSIDQLSSGLLSSLARLRRKSVSIAFLHNPDAFPKRVIEVDRFAQWARESGRLQCVGISILGSRVPRRLLQFDEIEVVMVECAHLPALVERHRDWLERRRVVVRSLFSGGAPLHKLPSKKRAEFIGQTIAGIDQLWPVWRYIVAPRTLKQASQYALAARQEAIRPAASPARAPLANGRGSRS